MLLSGHFTAADYSTRRLRRSGIKTILECLSCIRDAELIYLENVPENFQNSESFETGECAVDAMDEIIDLLVEVY